MSILLTGGAGFIGSACLARFMSEGHDVVVVDNFEPTLYSRAHKEKQLAWAREFGEFEFIEGDIRDEALLERIFSENTFSLVLHIAAVAGVRPSIAQPELYFDINVTGTSRVLKIARQHGVRDFILASSSSVYGGNTKTPFSEQDSVEDPISPYAASKRAMELLAKTDQHLHGGNITCLRFFTVYGPRQRPQMAIHKFMRHLTTGQTIPMFGDGGSGRDYTFIEDIVDGIFRAIEHRNGFNIYNLGGDRVVLLRDLIEEISDTLDIPATIDQLPMQPGDVQITSANISAAHRDLGYAPRHSLREGLEKMWKWYQTEFL